VATMLEEPVCVISEEEHKDIRNLSLSGTILNKRSRSEANDDDCPCKDNFLIGSFSGRYFHEFRRVVQSIDSCGTPIKTGMAEGQALAVQFLQPRGRANWRRSIFLDHVSKPASFMADHRIEFSRHGASRRARQIHRMPPY